jgi:hypothetical protein
MNADFSVEEKEMCKGAHANGTPDIAKLLEGLPKN